MLNFSFPVELQFGHFLISAHDVFEFMGYLIGFRYYKYLQTKGDNYDQKERLVLFASTLMGAYFGSQGLGYLEHLQNPSMSTAKTVVGGLLGGLLVVEIVKRFMGYTKSSGDLITYPIIAGLIIGRVGCFLSGLTDATHGSETSLPWGINLGDGIFRHPVQIYEIIFLILLSISIRLYEQFFGRFSDGNKFISFLLSYLIFRFYIEFIKPVSGILIGLSAIQIGCALGITYYTLLLLKKKLKLYPRG